MLSCKSLCLRLWQKNQQPQSTKGNYLCYLCHNPDVSPNISGGRVNNSNVAFSSPDTSTSKSDNPKSSGSYGSAKFTEPNCSIEGSNRSELIVGELNTLIIRDVEMDFTSPYRYLDIHISSTITVKTHSSAKYLESKLCHYMRPKCHPIFFDSTINSPGTVRLNIYQAFLLCAMKFHCYFRSMSDASIKEQELLHIAKRTFRYMHSLIVRRFHDVQLQYNACPVLKLRRKETMWLGLSAFLRVLQKKRSRYKDLLALLREEIRKCGHLDLHNDDLRYAVDDSHSLVFWKFKF